MAAYRVKANKLPVLHRSVSARCLDHCGASEKIGTPSTLIGELKKMSKMGLLAVATSLIFVNSSPANARSSHGAFLVAQSTSTAPGGFSGVCSRYNWACANTAQAQMSNSALLRLAKVVNNKVNRKTRSIEDKTQFGREEYWTLPTRRGGDCEDFALLKKKTLIEHGVASKNLLIATVLDTRLRSHAVLVVRTAKGDFVLDNLNKRMLPWKKTGYTFLKLQNPKSLSNWDAILAGGIIKDRATASSSK